MNLGWFGVPPLGGSIGLGRLKPGLQSVRGSQKPLRSGERQKTLWRSRSRHFVVYPADCSVVGSLVLD